MKPEGYIHALRFAGLNPLYDRLMRLFMKEEVWRPQLLAAADLQPEHLVLDVACGTGSQVRMASAYLPALRLVGVDGDRTVLMRAAAKCRGMAAQVTFIQSYGFDLPIADGSVDRILCSLFFHHLRPPDKTRVLIEMRRVLRPGGIVALADWDRPTGVVARAGFLGVQLLDGFETTSEHRHGRFPERIVAAEFERCNTVRAVATIFGLLAIWTARKP